MFDIGFSELLLIAVVALVVLGPERLPKAARFAGLWVRKARAQWYSVKAELERELAAEDVKRQLQSSRQQFREVVDELDSSVRSANEQARREFEALRDTALAQPGAVPEDSPALTPTDTRGDDVSGH